MKNYDIVYIIFPVFSQHLIKRIGLNVIFLKWMLTIPRISKIKLAKRMNNEVPNRHYMDLIKCDNNGTWNGYKI